MMSVSRYLSPSTSTSWPSVLDHDLRDDPFGFSKNDSYPSLALLAIDIRIIEVTTFKLSFMRSRGIVEMEPARSKNRTGAASLGHKDQGRVDDSQRLRTSRARRQLSLADGRMEVMWWDVDVRVCVAWSIPEWWQKPLDSCH